MAHKAPGKHYREGMSLVQFMDLFPTEEAAHDWFAAQRWGKTGRHCPRCGSVETKAQHAPVHVLVPRLQTAVQRSHRHPDGRVPVAAAQMGDRHLHAPDQSQGHQQHEAAPGHRRDAKNRMVHAPAHPQGVGKQR